ncbi:hypothetical protein Tco_1304864 [Tanacetum coccineum]
MDEEAPVTSSEPPKEKDVVSTYSEHTKQSTLGWSRHPEQNSGADLLSRPPEQTSGPDHPKEIAGRSKDGSGSESVASVLLGDKGAATTSKVVEAEPHSFS